MLDAVFTELHEVLKSAMEVTAEVKTYTNYSSYSANLKTDDTTLLFDYTGTSVPTAINDGFCLYYNSTVTMRIANGSFSADLHIKDYNQNTVTKYDYISRCTYDKLKDAL